MCSCRMRPRPVSLFAGSPSFGGGFPPPPPPGPPPFSPPPSPPPSPFSSPPSVPAPLFLSPSSSPLLSPPLFRFPLPPFVSGPFFPSIFLHHPPPLFPLISPFINQLISVQHRQKQLPAVPVSPGPVGDWAGELEARADEWVEEGR